MNRFGDDPFSVASEALFTDSYFGSVAVTVICKKIYATSICTMAVRAKLDYSTAIEISKNQGFRLYFGNHFLTEMKQDIFYFLASPHLIDVEIPDAPVTDMPLPEVRKAHELSDGDAVYTAKVDLSACAYQASSLAVISPLISAAFDGYNKKNCGFSFAFDLKVNLDGKENTAAVYSSISSLYRAAMELGFPVESVNTALSGEAPSLSVYLRIAPHGPKATLSTEMSKETVKNFSFDGRAYPDFSIIKDLLGG